MAKLTVRAVEALKPRSDAYKVTVDRGLYLRVAPDGLHWADGKLRSARVVGMHGDHVAIQDEGYSKAFKVHYAAILTEPAAASTEGGPTPADVELTRPAPPPEVAGRADFRVGNR